MSKNLILIFFAILIYSCSNIEQELKYNSKVNELNNKAAILISQFEYDSAMYFLDELLKIDSLNQNAYGLKATIYINKGLTDSALIQFEKQLKLAPEFAEVWSITAMIYDKKGDSLKAKEYYLKSISIYDNRISNPKESDRKVEMLRSNRLNRALSLILSGQIHKGRAEALLLKQEEPNSYDTIMLNQYLIMTRLELLNEYLK